MSDPTPETLMASDSDAALKLAALRRIKLIATLALFASIGVFALARMMETRWPLLSFVAAFAEAAAIGGLADWYAVVALFRRPLGLPIPHTAIIPANQNRIADNLGRFIEANFLAPGPVREKLKQVDFARMVSEWLADPRKAAGLADLIGKLVPQAVSALDDTGLRIFLTRRFQDQIDRIELAPLAGELLTAFSRDRGHQRIFDEVIGGLERFLRDEAALAAIRERIRKDLPSLFTMFHADAYVLKKLISSAASLLEEVRGEADHPLRAEFDSFFAGFIERLRSDPEYAERAEQLKRDLMARPEIAALAEDMWTNLKRLAEADIHAPDSALRRHMARLFVETGHHLAGEKQLGADMNEGFVAAFTSLVESQKGGVSVFIADQVRSWDLGQMTRLIEINIGRDLQFIRFNGMLIGGLAGLLLHVGERLLLD